jgi:hypothetical protein
MYNSTTPQTPLTYDALMASIHESNRYLTEQLSESRKESAESKRIIDEQFADTKRLIKETGEQIKETDRLMKELRLQTEKTDLQIRETEKQMKKSDLKWERLGEQMGGWANSHGSFAEEFFYNSFENGRKNFFGEKFNKISKNLKTHKENVEDEYDIVLFNHSSVAIVEVKFTVREDDIPNVLKKAETFRILLPEYKGFKVYLGMASLNFCKKMEKECIQKGIAVIKQVGEMVVIHDEHLKVF